ncbi:MAG: D-methionine transport system ATP-binding protein [Actinomycetota bacterium]|nr:D-methionine transport system ATP-binding protein [Actinomycetota bacterium]
MFRTEELVKTFTHGSSRIEALRGVSLAIPQGEVYGIIGRSGAGKSTLIRCLNLLERPTSGRVLLDDEDLTALPAATLRSRRRRIGMVFQHFHLLSSRSVLGNVTFPLEIQGIDRARRRARALELLDVVGLADRADDYPSRLSGGQKQRVGIARALAGSPRVLLCDEATSALDSQTSEQILDLLGEVNRVFGVTVVLITHEMSVVRAICTSAALMEDGRVVDSGPLVERVGDPSSDLGRLLLPLDPAPAADGERHLLLTFTDATAGSPVLSQLARDLGVDVTIRSGGVERIGGAEVGRLQVSLRASLPGSLRGSPGSSPGTPAGDATVDVDAVAGYLAERGVGTQVHA